jgi:hypothetical protein
MSERRRVLSLVALTVAACGGGGPRPVRLISFNTGSADIMGTLAPADNGGWGSALAATAGMYYGHGLAFVPVIEQVKAFFEQQQPDVVGFQELFYSGDCPSIPVEARKGFVCETWKPGDPSVVSLVLGSGYQVACNLGKNDKCIGVKKSFGKITGCASDFCLDGLAGATLDGCGKGSRVGRGSLTLADGGALTVVNVHGSSGFAAADSACRIRQYDQAFTDLGDGQPGANGAQNLIFGDMNTDPIRLYGGDPSATALLRHTGPATPFHFISDVGEQVTPSYGELLNIDHLISDAGQGHCWSAGATPEHPPVTPLQHFDHKPLVCDLTLPR